MDTKRRQLLRFAAAGVGMGFAASPLEALACRPTTPAKPNHLLIDVHCHIFNADDLAVRGFANHIFMHTSGRGVLNIGNWLSQMVDWLGQLSAPGIRTETRLLESILTGRVDPYDAYCRVEHPHGGILAQASNYRLHNALAMMALYPETDLFVPAMVDMDAHLGDQALVTPRQQVDLMEYIFVITGGRFHGYAAFDPLRQVRYDEKRPNGRDSPLSPLRIVKRAVMEQGFVGIKLYPPMGFRPIGNAALDGCKGINPRAPKYDAVLRELFDWCAAERVPVITHCNDSNHANVHDSENSECQHVGSPRQWAQLYESHPEYRGHLKVDLGHFGRADMHSRNRLKLLDAERENWPNAPDLARQHAEDMKEAAGFIAAMAAHPESLFADLSNYDTLDTDRLRKAFSKDMREMIAAHPHLARQLMYGTDWFMTPQGAVPYLDNMRDALPPDRHGPFYGANAARFLGLRRGEATRRRLEAFYRKWGIADPDWFQRVDSTPAG